MAWKNTTPSANEAIREREERYWQSEGFHSYTGSNGVINWTIYENAVFRVREKITIYTGLTESQAITLAKSLSAAPTFYNLAADGSSKFEGYSKRSTMQRANPCGGYNVTCVEKWTALYVNGQYVRGEPLAYVE